MKCIIHVLWYCIINVLILLESMFTMDDNLFAQSKTLQMDIQMDFVCNI